MCAKVVNQTGIGQALFRHFFVAYNKNCLAAIAHSALSERQTEDQKMPMVYIWTHEGKNEDSLKGISDGIAAAMQNVLKVPPDTFDHFINEMPKGRMIYDRNYFGVPRSDAMTFIHFFFNTRPKELKEAFFEAVADEVIRRAGLERSDLLMSITEVPAENWWAFGRTTDPVTGYDTRMEVDKEGNAK